MNAAEIIFALSQREVTLNPPASDADLKQLERLISSIVDPLFVEIFCNFNGYNGMDMSNYIELWSINNIINNMSDYSVINGNTFYDIGDILLESDRIICCFENKEIPIYCKSVQTIIAPTATQFYEMCAIGASRCGA